MIDRALRKIAAELTAAIDGEHVDAAAVRIAATRINAQAEMIEEGLAE